MKLSGWIRIGILVILTIYDDVSSLPTSSSEESHEQPERVKHFDAFISYRRSTSRHLAMLLKVMLQLANVNAFLDVEDLEGGPWANQLDVSILQSPNFILVLSNGTLERARGDNNYADVINQEIREAVNAKRRIVLVFDDFDFPPAELFTPEINSAMANQGVSWDHRLVDQSLERLISYMTDLRGPIRKTHVLG